MSEPEGIDGPILVIGGTRGTGLLIARQLLHDGARVRVLARNPTDARKRLGSEYEIIRGDLTDAPSLFPAFAAVRHVIVTAGCRSGRPVRSTKIRKTEYEGILNTLAAARAAHFRGRLLYMTSSGVDQRSFWTFGLNVYKGNTLRWRGRAETAIRASSFAYTVIRTGMLTNGAARPRSILLTQRPLPLSPRYRIARADVAQVFCAALGETAAVRATFEIAWQRAPERAWREALANLRPDPPSRPTA
jgi:uncharacterized protein YbjT (DUF2867 family)